jgi:tripartite-type tricarboxylate transporter receptor subunit TctC
VGQASARAGHQGIAIRFVVPFGAEGASDRAARAFCACLGTGANAPSISVENLPGAGGQRGLEHANTLAARGEAVMLLGTPTTHVQLAARLGIAPDAAFAPLLGFGAAPNVLLVPPALGVHSVRELIHRARGEALVYASAGAGQTIPVCSAYFCRLAGIEMTHRPYDGGSATAYADFTAGRVQMYFDNLLGCRERIASGEALPLAVSSADRSVSLPEVPTLAECGFQAHALDVWLGAFAANGAPDTTRALADRAFAARLRELGLAGGPLDAQAFADQVESSRAAWREALSALA